MAAFTLPTTAEATVPAALQNTSQNATSYKWSFGDGSTSTAAAPTHTYAKEGTYTVTLRAYGANQDSAAASQPLTVAAYDVINHAAIKMAGSYDCLVSTHELTNSGSYTYTSKGMLTVARSGTNTITITTPGRIHLASYSPDPAHPTFYPFSYNDYPYSGLITFYPTGDSLHFDSYEHYGAGGNSSSYYRGFRQP